MAERTSTWKPYAALLAVYLIWGTTSGAIRLGVDTIPSAVLPCVRFLSAGCLLVLLSLLRGESFPSLRHLKIHAMSGFLLFFAGNSIVCWTVKYIGTGFGSVLVATTPLWMTLLSALVPPRERISALSWLGIMIGFLGMVVLLSPHLVHPLQSTPVFWWCMAGLAIMTFCWAVGSVYARRNPTPDSLFMSVGLQNLAAGLMLMPICFWTAPEWWGSWQSISTTSVWALLYLIVFGTMLATPCYLYVLKTLPVSVSSTFAYVTPVLTVIFGGLFLKENITPAMVLGAIVILSGVALVQFMNRPWAAKSARSSVSADLSRSASSDLPSTNVSPQELEVVTS